jgi:uroporphyrin-III C-methyltransferase
MKGKVFLVGAGPGDPDLLTVRALKLLQAADVVLHDDLVSPEILELIPTQAHIRNVGKRCGRKSVQQEEINALLVAFASFGVNVVRLKGGDPSIFGRSGEEMDALRKADVDFEVVPGVTSALASAAAAQVSLTQRGKSSAVTFLTNHLADAEQSVAWKNHVASGATLAVYMPGSNYGQTAAQLLAAGMQPGTPCAIISRAASSQQRIHRTQVAELANAPLLPAPTLLLIGDAIEQPDASISESGLWNSLPQVLPLAVSEEPFDNQVLTDREWRQ